MQARFTVVMAAAAMLSVFAGVGWGQAAAQPKPLVNADIVKMVKAGLAENTIVLAIQNKPSAFDTSPEELIRLKEQGVSQVVLNAISYNIAQVDSSVAQDEIQDHGAAALDLSRVLAPKMVTVNTDVSPPVFLAP